MIRFETLTVRRVQNCDLKEYYKTMVSIWGPEIMNKLKEDKAIKIVSQKDLMEDVVTIMTVYNEKIKHGKSVVEFIDNKLKDIEEIKK